jgi:hypothetical protein
MLGIGKEGFGASKEIEGAFIEGRPTGVSAPDSKLGSSGNLGKAMDGIGGTKEMDGPLIEGNPAGVSAPDSKLGISGSLGIAREGIGIKNPGIGIENSKLL